MFRACYRHQQAAAAAAVGFSQPPRGAALRVVGSCCPCLPSLRTLVHIAVQKWRYRNFWNEPGSQEPDGIFYTGTKFLWNVENRQLWVRPCEWLKLNFASCVVHQTRSYNMVLWTKPTIWLIRSTQFCTKYRSRVFYVLFLWRIKSVTPLDAARVNRTIFHNHSVHWYYITLMKGRDYDIHVRQCKQNPRRRRWL